ncbi:MAG: recombinase family protein [Lachnospiraceae bacterium]
MARKSRKSIPEASTQPTIQSIPYRAAAYVRLSVEDNRHKGDSIENQKAIIQHYIDMSSDIELSDYYIDNGTTGMNYNRPAFEQMLQDAENGRINCILCKDLSRLGRNSIDTGYYIEKHFPTKGVRFIAVNDDFDSEHIKDSNAGIMLHLKNLINEAYALDISRKVKAQQNEAMLAGEFVGARPPYGYVKADNNCHKLVVDSETAPVVRQIFDWVLNGISKNDIVRRLNEANIMTPSHYRKKQGIINNDNLIGKGLWQTFTINKILHSEIYCGDMVQGKSKSVSHKQTPTDEKEWIRVTNTHEAIISRGTFAKVQGILQIREKRSKDTPKEPYTPNIFKGKLFCGICGGSLHRNRAKRVKGPDVYRFCCLSNSRKARGSCVPYSMTEDELKEILIGMIQNEVNTVMGTTLRLRRGNYLIEAEQKKIKSELIELKSFLDKDDKIRTSLYENMVTGLITPDEYQEMRSHYEKKTLNSSVRIANLEDKLKSLEKQVVEYCDMSDLAAGVENTGITAELINGMIDCIRVFHNHHIEVDFKYSSGFEALYEVIKHD